MLIHCFLGSNCEFLFQVLAKRLHGSGENKDAKIVLAVDLQAMAPLPGVIQLQVRYPLYVASKCFSWPPKKAKMVFGAT